MMHDKRICKLVDFTNAKDCFPQISISGGVSYFMREDVETENCQITNIHANESNVMSRPLDEFEILVRYNQAVSILRKIRAFNERTLDQIISPISPFGLSTKVRGQSEKNSSHPIRMFSSKGESFISHSDIEKKEVSLDKYHVMISQTSAEHAGEPSADGMFRVLTKTMRVMVPNDVCTHSYIYAGDFDKKTDASNLLTYLKTRFVRFLVLQALTSIHLSRSTFIFVPQQDFTLHSEIDWSQGIANTEAQIYKKYKLTMDEVKFIEAMIKPMDGSSDSDDE